MATGSDGVLSGRVFNPVGVEAELKGLAKDEELAERLWGWTEEALREWATFNFPATLLALHGTYRRFRLVYESSG